MITYAAATSGRTCAAAGGPARRAARRRRSHRALPRPARGPRRRCVVEHPLQPFDPRNFDAGALVAERTWSFDASRSTVRGRSAGDRAPRRAVPRRAVAAGERAAGRARRARQVRQHPARAFLRQRLGIGVGDARRRARGRAVGRARRARAVGRRRAAARGPARRCGQGRRDRGRDRPRRAAAGPARRAGAREVYPVVEELVAAAGLAGSPRRGARSVDVSVELGRPASLVGTVPGVRGDVARDRHLLAGRAEAPADRVGAPARARRAQPGPAYEAVTLGRRRRRGGAVPASHRVGPADARRERGAATHLARARRPLRARDARAAAALLQDLGRVRAAVARQGRTRPRAKWDVRLELRRRMRSPSTGSCSAGARRSPSCSTSAPRDDEQGRAGRPTSRRGSGRYARRLWDGLLAREELIDR